VLVNVLQLLVWVKAAHTGPGRKPWLMIGGAVEARGDRGLWGQVCRWQCYRPRLPAVQFLCMLQQCA